MSGCGRTIGARPWQPASWQGHPRAQQADYDDAQELRVATQRLQALPPLVTSFEVLALREQVARAQRGEAFMLQGGDCAETFADCTSPLISNRLKVLLQMSLVLVHGLKVPLFRVGRFAGQYAKPRSTPTETQDGLTLPSYRGDLVNDAAFTAEGRRADPQRLLQGYAHSAMTMNFVRALVNDGFADLQHPEYWDLDWVEHSPLQAEYRRLVDDIHDSLRLTEVLAGRPIDHLERVDFYTSHEALLLEYEQALTRTVPRQDGWFNLGTHFPWIGMRTAQPDGAHVEYFRGIRNPVAVKVGPSMKVDDLLRIIDTLNPNNEPGRLTLIHRFGAGRIGTALPPLLRAVEANGRVVLWCCDPMHGNTETLASGIKTRRFQAVRDELERAFDVHDACGTYLGGVHLELTGENVTECLGGARALAEADLGRAYRSCVDPRLNYEQSMELAMLIVRKAGALRLAGKARTQAAV